MREFEHNSEPIFVISACVQDIYNAMVMAGGGEVADDASGGDMGGLTGLDSVGFSHKASDSGSSAVLQHKVHFLQVSLPL